MEPETAPEPGIEATLARLDAIVAQLEQPDTDLEVAMALYAEGVRIARTTGERLKAAELRISELRTSLEDAEPGIDV